ncbi:MAG: efflux RND transporter periplasmic adaptor subunit [bacterium]
MADQPTESDRAPGGVRSGPLNLSRRRWLLIPLVIATIAVAVAMLLVPGIEHSTQTSNAVAVRVQALTPTSITPILKGFGEVRPRHTWQGIAQVGGKVAWQHEDLQDGAQFPAGVPLLRIDRLDYESASTQADARLRNAQANLAEVRRRSQEIARAIAIEQRGLELAQQRYTRNAQLAERGHISSLQLEAEERDLLRQQQTLQSLQSEQSLQPDRSAAAQSLVSEAIALQQKAHADLARTEYLMPFDGRISEVHTEIGQFVPSSSHMFTVEATDTVEVVMEVPYAQLQARFPTRLRNATDTAAEHPLSASLIYTTGQITHTYLGQVERINPGLNTSNRAVALYITLENQAATPLPPLNQFLDVTIRGTPLQDVYVIPRTAVHNSAIWLADADNLLQVEPVQVLFTQDDVAVLDPALNRHLSSGARLVTTNLLFPASGMLLEPVEQ